jgi:hypothetical protein
MVEQAESVLLESVVNMLKVLLQQVPGDTEEITVILSQ